MQQTMEHTLFDTSRLYNADTQKSGFGNKSSPKKIVKTEFGM